MNFILLKDAVTLLKSPFFEITIFSVEIPVIDINSPTL